MEEKFVFLFVPFFVVVSRAAMRVLMEEIYIYGRYQVSFKKNGAKICAYDFLAMAVHLDLVLGLVFRDAISYCLRSSRNNGCLT